MLRHVKIVRERASDQGTEGYLMLDGEMFCRTLECPWRDNRANVSCIPCGVYSATLRYSPSFNEQLYTLGGTEPRTFIMIHAGNWAGDVSKGYKSDVEGCILVGDKITRDGQVMIHNSRDTLAALMHELGKNIPPYQTAEGGDVVLTIKGLPKWKRWNTTHQR